MQQTTPDASSPTAKDPVHDFRTEDGPANSECHTLKRTYLTLLPHTQLVELCLAFEAYSPLHVKSSLWPTNLAAAVTELQSARPPSSHNTQEDITSGPVTNDTTAQPPPTGALATSTVIDPRLSSDNMNCHARDEPSRPQKPLTSDDASRPTSQPEPSTSLTTPAAITPSQGPNPPTPYGLLPTQARHAYPHTPYYPPLGYHHNFPPQPSAPYPHAAFPPSHPPFPPAQSSGPPYPLPRHPHSMGLSSTDHNGIPAEDLPSYEDMLVEALTDLNEPDGSAPKSLFTWMASRYPLHTNFRPSASQALQKAFKRGRLEKGSNGKYRLNASWDGGSTARRTTRRPQSFVQMALPASHGVLTTSPFTHAPLSPSTRALAHNPSTPTPTSVQGKNPQYPHFPYQYQAAGAAYSGYGLSAPPPVSKGTSSAEQQPVSAAPYQAAPVESKAVNEEIGEGSDAWEAAQAILKAINFGSLLQVTAVKPPPAPSLCQLPVPADSVGAEPASDGALASDGMIDNGGAPGPVQVLSDRDRASLQAQLALLAAQLAEIAEDSLVNDLTGEGNGTTGEVDGTGVDILQPETQMH